MNQQMLPNATTMTIVATLQEECNLKELFETLPINNKVLSLRFNEKKPVDVHEGSNEIERTFLTILNGIQQSIDNNHLEITIRVQSRTKLVKLYKNSVIIVGCKSQKDGLEVIEEVNNASPKCKLRIGKIREIVVYNYNLPIKIDPVDMVKHFSESENFRVEEKGKCCLVKYDKNQFRIQNIRVIQTSRCIEEAQEAYNKFINEIKTIKQ